MMGAPTSTSSILYICAVGGHGGPVQSLFTVLRGMDQFDRHLIGSWSPQSVARVEQENLAEELAYLDRPRGAAATMRAAAQVLRFCSSPDRRPVLIHANGLTELVIALPAARLWNIPVLVWVHNSECPRSARLLRPIIRSHSRQLHWAAVSSLARQVVVDAGLAEAAAVEIIPNPISPSVLGPRTTSCAVVRIGYLGTTRAHKGFDFLPGVIEGLLTEQVQWRLYTNPGESSNGAWERLLAYPADRVFVPGRVLDVASAYSECDIVFVPSRQESFCRVVAEAMLNGIPVVASSLPPLEDLLGPGIAGFTFPVGDTGAAVESLRHVIRDADLRERLGREGRNRALAYMPEPITRALIAQYGHALDP